MRDLHLNVEKIKSELPETKPPECVWLWHSDYYDGPLSGMVKYQGIKHWCLCIHEDDEKEPDEPGFRERIFAVFELSEQELGFEMKRHELFDKYVGTHTNHEWDADQEQYRRPGKVREAKDMFKKFYNHPRYGLKAKSNYADQDRKVVAWFRG